MSSTIGVEKLRGVLEVVRLAMAETELESLLALIPQQACDLLETERATVYLIEKSAGELYSAVAIGLPNKTIRLKSHQGAAGFVASTGQPLLLNDAYADPRFYSGVDELTGYRTRRVLCVPIKNRRGDILGVLEILNKKSGEFTPDDQEILSLLAAQIGVALANAQVYEGLRTSLDRLTRLMKVGAAISQELDLDALLRVISQTTSQLLQAERSTVFIVDRAKGELWSRVAEGLAREEIRIPLTRGIAGAVAQTGTPVRISDVYADPRFNREVDKHTGYRTRNMLCAPMRNLRRQVIGVFQVLNKKSGDFTPLDEQLLASLSSQAAVAIENAQLHEQVQQALEQLQSLDKMKSDFLSAISHELRTPLAPILGYAEILLAGGMGALPASAQRGVQAISESGKRLLNLVESLLAFIRLDQGEVTLHLETVDLVPLLTAAVETFRTRAAERKLTLTLGLPPGLPGVVADPQELAIAVTHLLDNAIKFTPTAGAVTVRAAQVADVSGHPAVEVTFHDTGIGIPPEQQAKVFERFYQIDGSLTRQFGGVGIGLAVAKQIVEGHGSRITVESEPNKGSTFRFTLPMAA
jgi:signal transduction histidine kinase